MFFFYIFGNSDDQAMLPFTFVYLCSCSFSYSYGKTFLWLPYVIGQAIDIFILCFLLSFFSSPNLSVRRLDVYHTPHMVWP